METKHTPGPWLLVSDPGHFDSLTTIHGGGPADRFPHWQMIVQVGGADVGALEANARLIAAAPELLAALQELRYACTDKAEAMADEAISKAIGA